MKTEKYLEDILTCKEVSSSNGCFVIIEMCFVNHTRKILIIYKKKNW